MGHLFTDIEAMYNSPEVTGLLARKDIPSGLSCESVYSAQQSKAWVTTNIFGAVLEHTILDRPNPKQKHRFVLMDNCSAHTDADVLKIIRKHGWRTFLFPPYCTSLFQPLDLCANANFKRNMTKLHHSLYNMVLASEHKPDFLLTAHRQILNVAYAWNETSSKSVTKGFELMLTNLYDTFLQLQEANKVS